MNAPQKVILFANTDWYLFNYRLPLARRLRAAGIELLMLSPPGPYGAKLREEGFRWEPVPMSRRSLNPYRELRLLAHLTRCLRRERPEIVHGFTIKCAVYGCLAARLAGVRGRVGAVAGLGYVFASESRRARALRPVVRGLLRVAFGGPQARLILQNPDDVSDFRQSRMIHEAKIRLIPSSGVDCGAFAPESQEHNPDGPLRVILATRLLWEKGVREYVEAARLLAAEGRGVRFLLAGRPDPGNPGSVPEQSVRDWARAGVVEWLGHVEDMPSLLSRVHVLVLPSYYREGVPKTLIEGAAAGLALITTDTPGCREVVTDEVTGLLIPPRDPEALASAIVRLHEAPDLVRRMGRAARRKALTEFDERIVFERTIGVYAEVIPELRERRSRLDVSL